MVDRNRIVAVSDVSDYDYKFNCFACGREQTLKRKKRIEKTEKIEHICWHCGDHMTVVLGADDSVDGFDAATITG